MFSRPHHQRIAHVLESLNPDLFKKHKCYFGGGTAIVLRFGEFRESHDIDFLVSDREGYRDLRQAASGAEGSSALIKPERASFISAQQIKIDQYGIRTRLHVFDQLIKFEIVHEGRIELEKPAPKDQVCSVPTLTLLDLAASKLLANSDRFADDSVFSRDIIDLAMMSLPLKVLRRAVAKAECAYGEAIKRDLEKSLIRLEERTGWLEQCLKVLAMEQSKAEIWQKIRGLRRVL
ncbi:MAG: nucleotidyl transferase AbiEii/AbiGii toxin family protein [Deltaproteobacteria bacterium]|nr:nucleotidyl transferase AbiEii/AbiGii toxin family protein [Deltaproteobacteria bacterium]